MSERHLAWSATGITVPETTAISQIVAISMATVCDGLSSPMLQMRKLMLGEVKGLAWGDTASTGRTGIQHHVHLTPKPSSVLNACFSVLSSALECRCYRFKSQLCDSRQVICCLWALVSTPLHRIALGIYRKLLGQIQAENKQTLVEI